MPFNFGRKERPVPTDSTPPRVGPEAPRRPSPSAEQQRTIEHLTDAARVQVLRDPSRRLKIAATLGILLEACATVPVEARTVEKKIIIMSVKDHASIKELARSIAEHSGDAKGSKDAAEYLIGWHFSSLPEWERERQRLASSSGTVAVINPYLIPIEYDRLERIVGALPRVWTHPEITESLAFYERPVFHETLSKMPTISNLFTDTSREWEAACATGYSVLDNTSSIICNADVLKEYGAEAALNEALPHEFAHNADPRTLPLPIQMKTRIWAREQALIDAGNGPESEYIAGWQASLRSQPNALTSAALLQESFAERLVTVFETAHATQASTSWETWRPLYENALVTSYGASPEGAHDTFEAIKAYFDDVDPTFDPARSAKIIAEVLPPPKWLKR